MVSSQGSVGSHLQDGLRRIEGLKNDFGTKRSTRSREEVVGPIAIRSLVGLDPLPDCHISSCLSSSATYTGSNQIRSDQIDRRSSSFEPILPSRSDDIRCTTSWTLTCIDRFASVHAELAQFGSTRAHSVNKSKNHPPTIPILDEANHTYITIREALQSPERSPCERDEESVRIERGRWGIYAISASYARASEAPGERGDDDLKGSCCRASVAGAERISLAP